MRTYPPTLNRVSASETSGPVARVGREFYDTLEPVLADGRVEHLTVSGARRIERAGRLQPPSAFLGRWRRLSS